MTSYKKNFWLSIEEAMITELELTLFKDKKWKPIKGRQSTFCYYRNI